MKLTAIQVITCFLMLFIFTSCNDAENVMESSTEVELGIIEIPLNESVTVEGTGMTLSYPTLKSDSRCPHWVDCVHPGAAFIELGINQDGENEDVELTRDPYNFNENLDMAEVNDYRFTLLDVFPDNSIVDSRTDSVIVILVEAL